MFVLRSMVLKKYLACRTFSICQPHSNESCLSKCTYTYKIETDNQLHKCVCGVLSIKDGGVTNILAIALRRRTIELQLLWWFYIVTQKWLTRNQYWTFCAENNMVNCSILKNLYSKHNTRLIFFSDNGATIWGWLSRLSLWEIPCKNIASVEANPHYLAWCWGRPKLIWFGGNPRCKK